MANFTPAVEKILAYEGGYVNDPDDFGGETNFGISKKSYPELNIKSLTRQQAIAIYKRDYWDKFCGDQLVNQAVAEELLDSAVNMGWNQAVKFAQKALNLLSRNIDILEDGLAGPKTIAAINEYKRPAVLVKVMNGLQFKRYMEIVSMHPEQEKFLLSWLSRVEFKG